MDRLCLDVDLLDPELLGPLTEREAEVEDGSLGTATPAGFGFALRDFAFDIGIYYRRSVDDIPRLHSRAVKASGSSRGGLGSTYPAFDNGCSGCKADHLLVETVRGQP
jgi:hypothetical protein